MSEQANNQGVCGKCRLPIHEAEVGLRHFGFFTAHSENRCIELLRLEMFHARGEVERLKMQLAREATSWQQRMVAAEGEIERLRRDEKRLDSRQISIGGCWYMDVDLRAAIDKHGEATIK